MDKVKRKLTSPYVSPYLRRPLRTLSDALSEREGSTGFKPNKRRRPAQRETARERESA